jgi:hypothetical protein
MEKKKNLNGTAIDVAEPKRILKRKPSSITKARVTANSRLPKKAA